MLRTQNAAYFPAATSMGWMAGAPSFGVLKSRVVFDKADEGAGGGGGDGDGKKPDGAGDGDGGDDAAAKLAEATSKLQKLENEKAELLKDTMKKKGVAAEAKKALETLQSQLKEALGEGTTLDDVKKLLGDRKTDEEKAMAARGEFDALKARLVGEAQKKLDEVSTAKDGEIKDLSEKLKAATKQIRGLLVTNAFSASAFLRDNLTLTPAKAERLYGEHFKVEDKDGAPRVVAYLGKTPLVDANGEALSFETAFQEIVNRDPERESIMRSKAAPGAGSGAENGGDVTLKKEAPKGVDAIRAGLNSAAKK